MFKYFISLHCADFAKSFDSIMIIGVESGAEKYPTKRVVQCKPIWKQTVWKYLKNVTYLRCFFFFYRFNNALQVLLFLSSFTIMFDLTSFFSKNWKFLVFVCKQSRQTAVPDILRKSVSVSYSVLAFFCRWRPSWSFQSALVGVSLVFG